MRVAEVFVSIQGESTFAGLACFFIRLAGCNLSCSYCDTPLSRGRGRLMRIADLAGRCRASGAAIAEITGGEPLLQPGFPALACALRDRCRLPVLVETNGSADISAVPAGVIAIMDVKTPGSGMDAAMDPGNIGRLRHCDQVKFVLTGRKDYEWARAFTEKHALAGKCAAVLFGPAFGMLDPARLARWILRDRLPVRLHVQLHRIAGVK